MRVPKADFHVPDSPNILIIKMWALGDILMASPILSTLKRSYPGCSITWLADKYYADILADNSYLDEVIAFDSGPWKRRFRSGRLMSYWKTSQAVRRDLLARKFDVLINFNAEKWWSLWFLVAPLSVGVFPMDKPSWLGRFYAMAVPRRVQGQPSHHNTEQYLLSVRAIGCDAPDLGMSIGETGGENEYAESFRREHGYTAAKPTIVIAPFATALNRVWETDRLALLADELTEKYDAQLILIGTKKDYGEAYKVVEMAGLSRIALALDVTMRQYVALLRCADVIVCGDSSPMHIAGALGTPFVALFGPTPADERAPLVGSGTAIVKPINCSPCDSSVCRNHIFRECMKQIQVEDVMQAIAAHLAGAPNHAAAGPDR